MTASILIVDDHPIFRRGLREVIEEQQQYRVVGEASDGNAAMAMAGRLRPDIVFLDLSMPGVDGLEVAEHLRKSQPDCRVVIITMYTEEALVDRALNLGAQGYLLKDDAYSEVHRCLELVQQGERYLSPSIGSARTQQRPAAFDSVDDANDGALLERLTPTQREVLKHLASYRTSKEIARMMQLSHRTVQNHRSNIAEALDLHGRNKLLEFAVRVRDLL